MKRSDKKKTQALEGETLPADPTPPKEPRRIDLSTLRDVRLEMAHVYREMDGGKIETQDGTRRTYVLRQIADVITIADIERRLVELEERQKLGGALPPRSDQAALTRH